MPSLILYSTCRDRLACNLCSTNMEETDVVITGGGPSGLALSVALSHQHIKNIVLELNDEICEDPRAIAVTGDTSRILRRSWGD